MHLSRSILEGVRGAAVAVTMGACGSPVPAPIVPEPVVPTATPSAVVDPVSYDEAREARRLGALDGEEAQAASRRDRRIAFHERTAARSRVARGHAAASPPWISYRGDIAPDCGRG